MKHLLITFLIFTTCHHNKVAVKVNRTVFNTITTHQLGICIPDRIELPTMSYGSGLTKRQNQSLDFYGYYN